MNKSEIFKLAHQLAKAALKRDNGKLDYRVTFAAALKLVYEQVKLGVLFFNYRGALGFVFTKTKKGERVIKVKVGSFAHWMLSSYDFSIEIFHDSLFSTFVEVTKLGKKFQELIDISRATGVEYQYVYFNEVDE